MLTYDLTESKAFWAESPGLQTAWRRLIDCSQGKYLGVLFTGVFSWTRVNQLGAGDREHPSRPLCTGAGAGAGGGGGAAGGHPAGGGAGASAGDRVPEAEEVQPGEAGLPGAAGGAPGRVTLGLF